MTTTEKLARALARFDNMEWLAFPNARQQRKQAEYERRARELIGIYEEARAEMLGTLVSERGRAA